MKITSFIIPIYDWKFTVFTNVMSDDDLNTVVGMIEAEGCTKEVLDNMVCNIKGHSNNASHVCNCASRTAFLVITEIQSEFDFWGCVPHELDHLLFYISSTHGMGDEVEARGYLAGFVYKTLAQMNVFEDIRKHFYENTVEIDPMQEVRENIHRLRELTNHMDPTTKDQISSELKDLLEFKFEDTATNPTEHD